MRVSASASERVAAGTSQGLVERASAGDAQAFDQIARSTGDQLYRRAYAILRHESDALDATQDALIRAWQQLPRLADHDRFDAWLDRILVNVCRDQLRRRGRRQRRESPPFTDQGGEEWAGAPSADTGISDDRRRGIQTAFQRLDLEDRTLLVLHHLERRSVSHLSTVLDIPMGTVKWRLHTARQRLDAELRREEVR